MATILSDQSTTTVADASADGANLWLAKGDLEGVTGWSLKPEGFCRDEICVPVPRMRAGEFVRGGEVNVAGLWRHLGLPLAHDKRGETWVLGASAADRSRRLQSLAAPDFTLPDLDGKLHSLYAHRGKKVLLVSWASW